jgi:hypothetical protein
MRSGLTYLIGILGICAAAAFAAAPVASAGPQPPPPAPPTVTSQLWHPLQVHKTIRRAPRR